MLSHLLHLRGVESVVVESRSREAIESTIRAGILEQSTVDLMAEAGVGERVKREGVVHRGTVLRFGGRDHRIDFEGLTGGRVATLYPQHEVLKDLIKARLDAGGDIRFESKDTVVEDVEGPRPARPLHRPRRPGAGAGVRLRRRLRRLLRREPPRRSAGQAQGLPPHLPLRLVRHPGGSAALLRGAGLRPARARLRAHQQPHAGGAAHVLPVRPDDKVENWSDDRIWEELQRAWRARTGSG
jgi:p-hydroxybenzoate 3-monooxygenase